VLPVSSPILPMAPLNLNKSSKVIVTSDPRVCQTTKCIQERLGNVPSPVPINLTSAAFRSPPKVTFNSPSKIPIQVSMGNRPPAASPVLAQAHPSPQPQQQIFIENGDSQNYLTGIKFREAQTVANNPIRPENEQRVVSGRLSPG
jgi:hypothetical protein